MQRTFFILAGLMLILPSTAPAEDRYGVFADGKLRTRAEEEAALIGFAKEIQKCCSCRSSLRMERKNGKWRISAGLGQAWFWVGELAFGLARTPSIAHPQAAEELKYIEKVLESKFSARRGVFTIRELLNCR